METLLQQAPLIAFLMFYYVYGARLVGMILGLWRPIRGLEARPIYWDAGIGALFIVFGLWALWRLWSAAPSWAVGMALVFAGLGGLMLAEWARRRVWLEGDILFEQKAFGPPQSLPLSALAQASLGPQGFWLALERADGRPGLRASLSMDGLDGLYAALLRAGVKGPAFEAFQAARQSQRRR